MEYILGGAGGVVQVIITLFLLLLWIGLCFFVPYMIGKSINRVLLEAKSFPRLSLLFAYVGGIGFFALFILVLGSSIIQIFSISKAEWWYKHLFSIGAIGNTVGIICSGIFGILTGKD